MCDKLGELHNFHLLAIPMHEKHTGQYMYDLVQSLLDSICPEWRNKLIACSTDGASNNTGRIKGLVKLINDECLDGFIRIWGGIHQLDLIVKKAVKGLMDDGYVKMMTDLTSHLRRQHNLISEMKSRCPKFVDTRWIGLRRLLKWLRVNRLKVLRHMGNRGPTDIWWIISMCLETYLEIVESTISKLQGKQMLLQSQRALINECVADLDNKLVVWLFGRNSIPATGDRTWLTHSVESDHSGELTYGVKAVDCIDFIRSRAVWVKNLFYDKLDNDEKWHVVEDIGHLFLLTKAEFKLMREQRDDMGTRVDDENSSLPLVFPKDVAAMKEVDFTDLMDHHSERIACFYGEEEVECESKLLEIFNDFKKTCDKDENLKTILQSCNDSKSTFNEAWKDIPGKFVLLRTFFGGFATVFPNTATVESDFSVMSFEKNDYRQSLHDISVGGIMHTKQREEVMDLPL